ncbi:Glutaredoxin-C4 [Pseudolycoriella hygida]|uniref:Glutaredoxin-2, mitochondrial n=1 Tax=Pseudolycoriella hygida TaxID=35572 RepID=A0A9Q0NHI9_9DIPT|nr:Glutaredoxin-C4 [Pseudolycoriella hygida]
MKLFNLITQLSLLLTIWLSTQTVGACVSAKAANYVRRMITKDRVVIFSKTYCYYSDLAKEQFNKLNVPFVAIELDEREDGRVIQSILEEMTGSSTVPRVYIDGEFIGGGTDVFKLNKSGKLKEMLHIQK